LPKQKTPFVLRREPAPGGKNVLKKDVIHHPAFATRDIAEVDIFYSQVVGFPVVEAVKLRATGWAGAGLRAVTDIP
jgi:hypothetical protein